MESNGERIGRAFLDHAAVHLEQDLMPKIRSCVELLQEKDVWWREAEVENSVGNLVLHLAGNVRQWIISGMGGAPDVRERPKEFSDRGSVTKDEALDAKNSTALATSSGFPRRFIGMALASACSRSLPEGTISWNMCVPWIGPGATMLTVMP